MRTKTVFTAAVNNAVADSKKMAKAVLAALGRFGRRDWGELCDEDKKYNDSDLKNRNGHVLGKYKTPEGDIYVNLDFYPPEYGYDVVTVMFCHEW